MAECDIPDSGQQARTFLFRVLFSAIVDLRLKVAVNNTSRLTSVYCSSLHLCHISTRPRRPTGHSDHVKLSLAG